MDETTPPVPGSSPGAVFHEHIAPWSKVSFAPPEAWVEEEGYDATLRGKEGEHLTHLLWSRQLEAGTGRSFHSTAVRLETSLAVQHESQWSVQLDPRTQTLTLHWLRVVRDGRRIDHLHRERMRLIQRETQLERLIIDGVWTLITVLDDVRPGDVLEAAFSYETTHPIRPKACEAFFVVPPQMTIGRYRLSVLSDPSSAHLAWKASNDAPKLAEDNRPGGRRRWVWEGAQLTPREPEPNQPGSCLDYTWVQVSDLANWRDLAMRASEIWATSNEMAGLETITEFHRPQQVDEAAVTSLVQYIQDDFRYLSMDLELGGWIPAAPGIVARRRYGDCKDLAWLAVAVLRAWGVSARPILVGTGLREQVASLLPMTSLFNHCVFEVEVGGKKRWFDLTERAQGGNFTAQAIGWFGHGLPVEACSEGLCAQPGSYPPSTYVLRETILVDTRRGAVSLVEQRVRTEGLQADHLRHARRMQGADEFAKNREEQAQRRYGKARRAGTLLWRDDRKKNVCELVEVFEITDVAHPDDTGQRVLFEVPANLVLQSIPLPPDKPRRSAWALPFPLEIRHEITVKAGGMTLGNRYRKNWTEAAFTASLDEPKINGAWTKTIQFKTNVTEIPAEQLKDYRKQLEKFLLRSTWRLHLPWGHPRRRRGSGFGEFPPTEEERLAFLNAPSATKAPDPLAIAASNELKLSSGQRRHDMRRSDRDPGGGVPKWTQRLLWFIFVAVMLSLSIYRALNQADS
jgi:transglutaminase-like putative cysteine protease